MLGIKMKLTIGDHDKVFGPGVARLMEKVDECGSLSMACRQMHMAYSKGWRIVKKAEEELGFPLMQGMKGGKDHGSMTLTNEGREMLMKFRELERRMQEHLDILYPEIFGEIKK